MEGTLWKWTNYWAGWQPRWFILDDGVLSYYTSQDDTHRGCKGSIKMSVCDVVVHPTDDKRLDLIIPGEQHFYVKAANSKERQQWLVALGSCKASLKTLSTQQQHLHHHQPQPLMNDEWLVAADEIKMKKSELRLYCDLLMQQVHSVKAAVTTGMLPDPEKLDDATSLLSATCDTFIKSLEECMSLCNSHCSAPGSPPPTVNGSQQLHDIDTALPSTPVKPYIRHPKQSSVDRTLIAVHGGHAAADSDRPRRGHGSVSSSELPSPVLDAPRAFDRSVEGLGASSASAAAAVPQPPRSLELDAAAVATVAPERAVATVAPESGGAMPEQLVQSNSFFGQMKCSFPKLLLSDKDDIETRVFLDCCTEVSGFFDKLSTTAFAPVKADFIGNIKKINQKYSTNPEAFETLQKLVAYEMSKNQHLDPNSATQALLWLKRGLEFIKEFLKELKVQTVLSAAGYTAYERSLKPYHGFVVRSVFSLAMRAAPYRTVLLAALVSTPSPSYGTDSNGQLTPELEKALFDEMHDHLVALDRCCLILTTFYRSNNLDSNKTV